MKIINLTELKEKLSVIVESVIQFGEPVFVNTRKGNAVILSEEYYLSLKESAYLLDVPCLFNKIKEGEKEDIKKMYIYNMNEKW